MSTVIRKSEICAFEANNARRQIILLLRQIVSLQAALCAASRPASQDILRHDVTAPTASSPATAHVDSLQSTTTTTYPCHTHDDCDTITAMHSSPINGGGCASNEAAGSDLSRPCLPQAQSTGPPLPPPAVTTPHNPPTDISGALPVPDTLPVCGVCNGLVGLEESTDGLASAQTILSASPQPPVKMPVNRHYTGEAFTDHCHPLSVERRQMVATPRDKRRVARTGLGEVYTSRLMHGGCGGEGKDSPAENSCRRLRGVCGNGIGGGAAGERAPQLRRDASEGSAATRSPRRCCACDSRNGVTGGDSEGANDADKGVRNAISNSHLVAATDSAAGNAPDSHLLHPHQPHRNAETRKRHPHAKHGQHTDTTCQKLRYSTCHAALASGAMLPENDTLQRTGTPCDAEKETFRGRSECALENSDRDEHAGGTGVGRSFVDNVCNIESPPPRSSGNAAGRKWAGREELCGVPAAREGGADGEGEVERAVREEESEIGYSSWSRSRHDSAPPFAVCPDSSLGGGGDEDTTCTSPTPPQTPRPKPPSGPLNFTNCLSSSAADVVAPVSCRAVSSAGQRMIQFMSCQHQLGEDIDSMNGSSFAPPPPQRQLLPLASLSTAPAATLDTFSNIHKESFVYAANKIRSTGDDNKVPPQTEVNPMQGLPLQAKAENLVINRHAPVSVGQISVPDAACASRIHSDMTLSGSSDRVNVTAGGGVSDVGGGSVSAGGDIRDGEGGSVSACIVRNGGGGSMSGGVIRDGGVNSARAGGGVGEEDGDASLSSNVVKDVRVGSVSACIVTNGGGGSLSAGSGVRGYGGGSVSAGIVKNGGGSVGAGVFREVGGGPMSAGVVSDSGTSVRASAGGSNARSALTDVLAAERRRRLRQTRNAFSWFSVELRTPLGSDNICDSSTSKSSCQLEGDETLEKHHFSPGPLLSATSAQCKSALKSLPLSCRRHHLASTGRRTQSTHALSPIVIPSVHSPSYEHPTSQNVVEIFWEFDFNPRGEVFESDPFAFAGSMWRLTFQRNCTSGRDAEGGVQCRGEFSGSGVEAEENVSYGLMISHISRQPDAKCVCIRCDFRLHSDMRKPYVVERNGVGCGSRGVRCNDDGGADRDCYVFSTLPCSRGHKHFIGPEVERYVKNGKLTVSVNVIIMS